MTIRFSRARWIWRPAPGAALVGMAVLMAGSTAALAQPAISMSPAATVAYVIIESHVTDPEGSKAYQAALPETLVPHSGQMAVHGGQTESREGEPPKQVSMIVFPSMAEARNWYESDAYQQLLPMRNAAETARVFIVEGVTMIPQPGLAEFLPTQPNEPQQSPK